METNAKNTSNSTRSKINGKASKVTSHGIIFWHLKCVGVEDLMDQMLRRSAEHMRRNMVFSQYHGSGYSLQ